jgi:hypothetical protein
MDVLSIVKLDDVNGRPTALVSALPCPLKIGDPIGLRFKIRRESQGRSELLTVTGQFRVVAVGFDGSTLPRRQLLTVESIGKPPTWVSVKRAQPRGALAPAISPRTVL